MSKEARIERSIKKYITSKLGKFLNCKAFFLAVWMDK